MALNLPAAGLATFSSCWIKEKTLSQPPTRHLERQPPTTHDTLIEFHFQKI